MSAPEWFVIGCFIGFMLGYVYRAVKPPEHHETECACPTCYRKRVLKR